MMEELWEEEAKEIEEYEKSLGEYVGYDEEVCKKCGRQRVEVYSSGRKICEKCHYDRELEEFDYIHCWHK